MVGRVSPDVTQIMFRQYAREGVERFDQGAFASSVGKRANLKASVGVIRNCLLLVGAEVGDDGSYVDLIYELPANVAALLMTGLIS